MKVQLFSLVFVISQLFLSTKQDRVEAENEVDNFSQNTEYHDEKADEERLSNTFSAEWEKRMFDYEPNYVYMIPIKPRKTEKFYEDIEKVPVNVRGAFLTDENIKDKIEFIVIDPQNKLVYKNYTNECIFEFEAKVPGEYKIKFRNSQSKHDLKVTFTMNTAQETVLKKEHLSFSEEKLNGLVKFMNNIKLEGGILTKKKEDRRKTQKKNNRYVFTFAVLETAVLIGVSAFQFYYIKKIISSKE
mmetsp:Transcript_19580/g.20372  ORF Transcript_19580/g.20372 Transcript_19580/m.20372 type:complete len:244 (-) Transcript_19580:117-848(-)